MWPTEVKSGLNEERTTILPWWLFEVIGAVVPQSVEDGAEKTQHGQNPWARYRTHNRWHGPVMNCWNMLPDPRRDPERDKENQTKWKSTDGPVDQ